MADTNMTSLLAKHFGNEMTFAKLLADFETKDTVRIKELIKSIESLVKDVASSKDKLTYNQLRNIYEIVKKEEFKTNLRDFVLELPKLAYIEARQDDGNGRSFVNFIRLLATEVNTEKQYENFIEIMTAFVAYHKLHG